MFSVKGEDLLFLDYANIRLDDDLRTRLRRARPARRAVRLRRLLRAAHPRRPDRPAARHRPHQRRRGVLVDARRVLRPAAAALRVRRRRGRTQPVHDGRPPGRRPAAAGRRARTATTARSASTATSAAPTTNWSTSSSTGSPTTPPAPQWAGPGHRRRAPSTRSSAGCARRCGRCARIIRADLPDTAAPPDLHRNQQVTVVDLHNLRERAQRFVVGVVLAAETARKEAPGRAACCSP